MAKKRLLMKPYPLGAHVEAEGIRFSFASKSTSCGVILYNRATGEQIRQVAFSEEDRIGNVYCKYITDLDEATVSYQFYEDDAVIADERARGFAGTFAYGDARAEEEMKAVFNSRNFEWEGDKNPCIPYNRCICYCLHVRGFTKHTSSGVKHKGTFRGVVEKIPYLKESGITTVELQPAYEFFEVKPDKEQKNEKNYIVAPLAVNESAENQINYWGYRKGFYYTPKAGYAAGADAVTEFKNMIKEFHANGMEVVMQFYFPKEISEAEIPEILRFWVLEYHVDGFHLMGDNIPADLIAKDALLADSKIWYYCFDTDRIYDRDESPKYCNLAEYQDDYLYAMRKFLKGDEDMLGNVLYHMRHIPDKAGRIHYMSNYYGFTLKDMVSYDHKHNEENGEDNRDGNDYNCSWNCGEEGATRKKKVAELRRKQLKNAMCMLMLSQSTPLIFMGDEFGNSQQGNNNPYCQDNRISWLDWKDLDKNKEIYSFWKKLIALRSEHPILRPDKAFRIMDYAACGYPDLSYHGESAWRPKTENYFRHVGIMYCGKYAKKDRVSDDDFFYVGINMHWETHELALPKLPKGLVWKPCILTESEEKMNKLLNAAAGAEAVQPQNAVQLIPARSIIILKSEKQND